MGKTPLSLISRYFKPGLYPMEKPDQFIALPWWKFRGAGYLPAGMAGPVKGAGMFVHLLIYFQPSKGCLDV